MIQGKISLRYARALYLSAKEANVIEKVRADLETVKKTIESSFELQSIFKNPLIQPYIKKKILNGIFKSIVSDLTLKFIQLITHNKREVFILDIVRSFDSLYKKERNIKSVVLTTAGEIDINLKTKISTIVKKYFNTEIDLQEEQNKELIGGFVLRVEDNQYDSSVASQLRKIRTNLVNTTFERKI